MPTISTNSPIRFCTLIISHQGNVFQWLFLKDTSADSSCLTFSFQFLRSTERRERYALTSTTQKKLSRTKRRTNLLTFLLFAAFAFPWLPYTIVSVLRDFELIATSAEMTLFAIAHLTAMTSTMWNPIIYCGLNQEFRRCLLQCVNKELAMSERSSLGEGRFRSFPQVVYTDGHFENL